MPTRDIRRARGDTSSDESSTTGTNTSGRSSRRRSSRPSTETVSGSSTVGLSARERQLTANPSASSGASDSTPAQFNTSETDNFVGSGTVSGISSGVDFDPTREPSTDPVDRVRAPLDQLSGQLQPTLRSAGDFAGRGIATASLAPAIEEQAFGTRRSEDAIRGGSQEAAAALDIPGLASAGIGAADFTVRGTRDDRTRREAATETATQGASDFASAFSERPVETTGRAVGAVGGGFAVGTAGARLGRQAPIRIDSPDFGGNFRAFAGDERGQMDFGAGGRVTFSNRRDGQAVRDGDGLMLERTVQRDRPGDALENPTVAEIEQAGRALERQLQREQSSTAQRSRTAAASADPATGTQLSGSLFRDPATLGFGAATAGGVGAASSLQDSTFADDDFGFGTVGGVQTTETTQDGVGVETGVGTTTGQSVADAFTVGAQATTGTQATQGAATGTQLSTGGLGTQATATGFEPTATATSGLGAPGRSVPPARLDFEDEGFETDFESFDFDEDSDLIDSGILSGDEAFEIFGFTDGNGR